MKRSVTTGEPSRASVHAVSMTMNVMRALSLALIAFALVGVMLGAIEGHLVVFLPLAATALIAIAVIRLRMQTVSSAETDERSF